MLNRRTILLTISYVLLTVVMAGRVALWVALFDRLFPLAEGLVSVFSVLMAVALVFAIAGSAYVIGRYSYTDRPWWIALASLIFAALLDGVFNIAEAHYIAATTGTFDSIEVSQFLSGFFDFSITMIGLGPTILTILLAATSGALAEHADELEHETRMGQVVERKPVRTRAMDDHWQTIGGQCSTTAIIDRAQVEQWLGIGRTQALNVLRYGKQWGMVRETGRGVYVFVDAVGQMIEEG